MDSSVMRMGNFKPKHSIPSFYRILLDNTLTKKQIPDAFMKKLLLGGGFSSNAVFLETHSGQKWRVEIENDGDKFYFSRGWLAFVRDTKTRKGDLLAFSLINSSTFKVSIFGPGGCEKDFSPASKSHCERGKNVIIEIEDDDEEGEEEEEEEEEEEDYDDDNGGEMDTMEDIQNPIIMRRIRKSHCAIMRLPRKFVSESEIGSERETVLRNKEGKEWSVMVRCRHGGVFLQSGLMNFFKDNELVEGDLCTFQYINGDGVLHGFIKVDIVEYGARRRKVFKNQIS